MSSDKEKFAKVLDPRRSPYLNLRYSGKLIVFEGSHGGGKTTQVTLLANWLKEKGFESVCTQEVRNKNIMTALKELIAKDATKHDPLAEAYLFAADRKLHLDEEIIPALKDGKIVLLDRYYHSSIAHQTIDSDLLPNHIIDINHFAIVPDLVIIVDISHDAAQQRIDARGNELRKFETGEFQRRLRRRYLDLPMLLPGENIKIVQGEYSIEQVQAEIRRTVSELLGITC